MAFLATLVAPPHWGTTFGGFGSNNFATGSRGRATVDLVGASNASFVLSPQFTLSSLSVYVVEICQVPCLHLAGVCTLLSSPPWLVWLTPLWTNVDRNSSFSVARLPEFPQTSVTQK